MDRGVFTSWGLVPSPPIVKEVSSSFSRPGCVGVGGRPQPWFFDGCVSSASGSVSQPAPPTTEPTLRPTSPRHLRRPERARQEPQPTSGRFSSAMTHPTPRRRRSHSRSRCHARCRHDASCTDTGKTRASSDFVAFEPTRGIAHRTRRETTVTVQDRVVETIEEWEFDWANAEGCR